MGLVAADEVEEFVVAQLVQEGEAEEHEDAAVLLALVKG